MNKIYILMASTLVLLYSLVACNLTQKTPHEIYEETTPSMVRFLSDARGPKGSGFIVESEFNKVVITNAHVCDGLEVSNILRFEGLKDLEIIKSASRINKDTDLCLFVLPKRFQAILKPLTLGTPSLHHDLIYSVGYPLANPLVISSGYATSRRFIEVAGHDDDGCEKQVFNIFFGMLCIHKYDLISTSTPIYPGNSGSPALNSQGEVIGVFNSGEGGTAFGNFIPLEYLKQMLKGI